MRIRTFDIPRLIALLLIVAGVAAVAVAAEYNTSVKKAPITSWSPKNPYPSLAKVPAATAAKRVDTLLLEDLSGDDKTPSIVKFSRRAGDEVFLRRVYLDLVGRNPTPDEVTAFVLDPSADKRAKVIDNLLADPGFGENWGRYWRDVIMYHRSDDRAQLAAPALQEYLSGQFNKNTPWDQTVRSFITATGDVRENGAAGLIMAQNGNTADITSEVSRIFMGVQIQCANCHDHKTDRWKREQFHQLAAFFPRIAVRPQQTDDKRTFIVAGNDRLLPPIAKKQADRPTGKPEHFMPDLKHPEQQGTKMQPIFFLTGQRLDYGTTDAVRRDTIAKWITAPTDEWFAKAFVNRVWNELVGEGFYEPVDDIGPDRTCTAPQSMDYLAHAFVDSGFDVKQLYRIVALTDAYQRESRSRRNPDEMAFAANCPERLRGDQLYDALVSALGMNDGPPGPLAKFLGVGQGGGAGQGKGAYGVRGPRGQFDQVFGYDPSTPRDEVTGSIPQALLLMNGPLVNRSINGYRRDTELGKILAANTDDDAVTTELYLRCFGREPNKTELKACADYVKQSKSRSTGYEDILWALVNSTEFLQRK
ncbi:MAG TPA: DUF1549 domain-containing protein [Pirellulales bacterium]|jgi:hypothetical protein